MTQPSTKQPKLTQTYFLPVDDPRHTEVLGYRVSTKSGRHLWDELDWNNWWFDYSVDGHIFSSPDCEYFHVECKDKNEGCVYRVRCWYAGRKYRGQKVEGVRIHMKDGNLCWAVHTRKEST